MTKHVSRVGPDYCKCVPLASAELNIHKEFTQEIALGPVQKIHWEQALERGVEIQWHPKHLSFWGAVVLL